MTGAMYTSLQGAQIDTKVQGGGGMDAACVGYDTRQGIQGEGWITGEVALHAHIATHHPHKNPYPRTLPKKWFINGLCTCQ